MRSGVVWAACVAATASGAFAQEARFLEPLAASVPLGGAVELMMSEGPASRSWPESSIGHFFARTAWTQDNRETIPPAEEAGSVARWRANEPGVMVLGCDMEPRIETVDAAAFGAFVARALPASRRGALGEMQAAGEVSLRRVESAKALVRVRSNRPEPVSMSTSKTGQAVEIRPLFDPTAITPGGDLPVKIYAAVPGPADGLVLATNTTTGETLSAPTGEDATARLTIPSAGKWRLEFHAVVPDEGDDAAWLVHTATLSFEVAANTTPNAGQGEEVSK